MAKDTAATAVPPEEEELVVGLSEKEKEKLFAQMDYPMHPIAASQPQTSPGDFLNLKNSIRKLGVHDDVELAKMDTGKWAVIDGNTRLRACVELIQEGIDKAENGEPILPKFFKHNTSDQKELWEVVNTRAARRNLKPVQRAAVTVKMDKIFNELSRKAGQTPPKESYEDRWNRLAKQSGCNKDHVQACLRASKMARDKDLLDRLADGTLTVPDARTYMDRRDAGKPDEETDAEKAKKAKVDEGEILLDADGVQVPEYLHSVFSTADEIEKFKSSLDSMKRQFAKIANAPGGELIQTPIMADAVKAIKDHLKVTAPNQVCPKAKPKKGCDKSCTVCKGYSYLTIARKNEIEAEKMGTVEDTVDTGTVVVGDPGEPEGDSAKEE